MYDPIGPLVTSYRCVCVDRAGDGVSSDACWSGPTSRGWIPPDVRFTRVADTAIRCFVCIHVDLVGGSGRCRGEAIRVAACKSNRSGERSDPAHPTSTPRPPTPFATRTKTSSSAACKSNRSCSLAVLHTISHTHITQTTSSSQSQRLPRWTRPSGRCF